MRDMVDWAELRDAYGSAEQVPSLLAAAEESGAELGPSWDDVWSRLYHQGTVYSASYAAIPLLAEICLRMPRRGYMAGLQLAGAILASTDGPADAVEVRAAYDPELRRLRDVAEAVLPLAASDAEFIYALETLAAFEDLGVWQRTLGRLADGEAPLECTSCGAELLLEIDDLPPRVARWNAEDGKRVVTPAGTLPGTPEARILGLALVHGRATLVERLRYFFGASSCPECDADLTIGNAIGWS